MSQTPDSDHLTSAGPSDGAKTAPPEEWQMPDAKEVLAFINSTPLVMSLLYDINLLPEQITSARNWNYMLAVCSHMDAALSRAGDTAADTKRLDWLSDKNQHIGNVELPSACVMDHLDSLRGAIDAAMLLSKGADTEPAKPDEKNPASPL